MNEGVVLWYCPERGFGFISDDSGNEVFVRHDEIRKEGFRSLEAGERVAFEAVERAEGLEATAVVRVER